MTIQPVTRRGTWLRPIGFMVLGGGLLVEIARYVAGACRVGDRRSGRAQAVHRAGLRTADLVVVARLVILAVSALIKHGVALRHEVDGIV
jgi:hypothetical protein